PLDDFSTSWQLYSSHIHPRSFPTRRSSDLRGPDAHRARRPRPVALLDVGFAGGAPRRCPGGGARQPRPPSRRTRGRLTRLARRRDRKSTRLNSSHAKISYAAFCLKKKTTID